MDNAYRAYARPAARTIEPRSVLLAPASRSLQRPAYAQPRRLEALQKENHPLLSTQKVGTMKSSSSMRAKEGRERAPRPNSELSLKGHSSSLLSPKSPLSPSSNHYSTQLLPQHDSHLRKAMASITYSKPRRNPDSEPLIPIINQPKTRKHLTSHHFPNEITEPSFAWRHPPFPASHPLREGEQSRLSTIDKVTDHSFNSHLESIPRDQSRASFIPPSPIKGSSSVATLARIESQSRNMTHNRSQPIKAGPTSPGSGTQFLHHASMNRQINKTKIGLYDPVEVKRGFDKIGLSKVERLQRHASDKQMSEKELSRFSFGPVNESQMGIQNQSVVNHKRGGQEQAEQYPLQRMKLFKIHLMPCPSKSRQHSGSVRVLPQKYGGLDRQRQRLEGLIANLRGQLKFYEREAQRIDQQYKRESRTLQH